MGRRVVEWGWGSWGDRREVVSGGLVAANGSMKSGNSMAQF